MKRYILTFMIVSLLLVLLAGCGDTQNTNSDVITTTTTTTTNTTATPENSGDNNQDQLVSDAGFRYKSSGDDGIVIVGYIGTDNHIVVPEQLDGKDVVKIGEKAFEFNKNIISIEIADTVTIIDANAFQSCDALISVKLSENLTRIERSAFMNCPSLETIVLPSSLQILGSEAFYNCTALKHINIPKSVTEWGSGAFKNSGVTTVTLEEGLESVGDNAFSYTNIQRIVLPDSIKTVDYMAFARCEELESVTLNEGLSYVGNSLFAGCLKLNEIVIPGTVSKMSEWALSSCSLEKVYFEGNCPENFIDEILRVKNPIFIIYYHEGAEGFTSPEWKGYTTEIW